MASNQLNTTSSSSSSASQAANQTPQAATAANFGASQSSGGVQPGTATALLSSQNGIKLSGTALSTVNLGTASTKTFSSTPGPAVKHHVSAPLLGFAILLVIAAAVMFYAVGRSVKTTT
jgi:hypothetical protein